MAKVSKTFLIFLIINLVASLEEGNDGNGREKDTIPGIKYDKTVSNINKSEHYLIFPTLPDRGCYVKPVHNRSIGEIKNKGGRCVLSVGDRCYQVAREGKASNVYVMDLLGRNIFVWCDTTTHGGGWIIIQNRIDGVRDFGQNWTEYKLGFGIPTTDFWYGLQEIYTLSSMQPHDLLVVLTDFNDKEAYAKYDDFEIGSEKEAYILKRLGEYTGTAGDSLSDHIGAPFSTIDKDNNGEVINCAETAGGGWWYKSSNCYTSNLNGIYDEKDNKKSVTWDTFHNQKSLKIVKMMIRPRFTVTDTLLPSVNSHSSGAEESEIECDSGEEGVDSNFGVNKCIINPGNRCIQVTKEGKKSNIYAMRLLGEELFVWCDTKTDGGGWIAIQRRIDGAVSFDQDYTNYSLGFGNLYLESWLGLGKIYFLTSKHRYELLITLKDFDDNEAYAKYDDFEIGSQEDGYRLIKLGEYNGTAGDSLSSHIGAQFGTHDIFTENNIDCAGASGGGWWYRINFPCYHSNLNGMYNEKDNMKSIIWDSFRGHKSLKEVAMLIRVKKRSEDGKAKVHHNKGKSNHAKGHTSKESEKSREGSLNEDGIETVSDCFSLSKKGRKSGIYEIDVPGEAESRLEVWCDTKTFGGSWILILRRTNGSENFDLDFSSYRAGFGNLFDDFWFGLENIRHLITKHAYELLIKLTDFDGKEVFAAYDDVLLGSEKDGYSLKRLGAYNGTAGDSLSYHVGAAFSTRDKDSDGEPTVNCAELSGGGGWFKGITCYENNVFGMYNEKNNKKSMVWNTFHNGKSLKAVHMFIRPILGKQPKSATTPAASDEGENLSSFGIGFDRPSDVFISGSVTDDDFDDEDEDGNNSESNNDDETGPSVSETNN